MNEIIAILTEAMKRNAPFRVPSSLRIDGVTGRKGRYIYIKARLPLGVDDIDAIRSVCDNRSLLLMECDASGATIIIEP